MSGSLAEGALRGVVALAGSGLFALALGGGALGGGAANACPYGPRPTDDKISWIATCAGAEPGQDKYITTKPALFAVDDPYALSVSATGLAVGGTGYVNTEAKAVRMSFGDIYLNPDLHAATYGSVAMAGQSVGTVGGIANASFHDVITIKALPPGATVGYWFTLEYDVDGFLTSTPAGTNAAPSSEGWAAASFNASVYELGNETNFDGDGVGWSTLSGDNGAKSDSILLGLFVELGHSYVIQGDLDTSGSGRGDAPNAAVFGADFSNTARFAGIRGYTDSTLTTELPDISVESAFGFDYRVNNAAPDPVPDPVPEPGSLALLATGAGLLAARPRRTA